MERGSGWKEGRINRKEIGYREVEVCVFEWVVRSQGGREHHNIDLATKGM